MSTGKSSIVLVWTSFRVERHPSLRLVATGGTCNPTETIQKVGQFCKKNDWSSADSPQNSLNKDPVPIAFTDRIFSTHVTPRAEQVEGLESRENQRVSISLILSDAHKRDDASLTKSCKRPRVSKQERTLPNSHLS